MNSNEINEELNLKVRNQLEFAIACCSGIKLSDNNLCQFCGKEVSKKNLRRHEKQCPENKTKLQFQCQICKIVLARKDRLKTHIQRHEERGEDKYFCQNISCMYAECDISFAQKTHLIEHLTKKHGLCFEDPKIISFNNKEEFEKWKEEEEEKSFSYYSQHSGKKVRGDNEFIYFYCQRDTPSITEQSFYRKTNRKRKIGQVKTGNRCVSMMQLKLDKHGKYEVKYFPTHSHPSSIEDWKFHPQSKGVNKYIEEQIALNVPPAQIVQSLKTPVTKEVGDDTSQNKLTKAQLITKNLVRLRAYKKRRANGDIENENHDIMQVNSTDCMNFLPIEIGADVELHTSSIPEASSSINVEEKLQLLLSLVNSGKLPNEIIDEISAGLDELINKC
ncbi:uncharacterized protein LOC128993490 [Macrosteles quadrilineatus]|uniref:uncharacterized protein LOC128993490 n=1 Tax=Macrosteles quadrilineatus TaxID=74068 RepID=UPI0023E0AC1D|nr:uncharacterized protein LOC128993490 [Macrosteles quadrilineatus]XP_054273407.1 uncharacterized protein LOC128993490 [Macrosteles quadrilineatus]